jgi:hypothetical protein
MQLFAATRGPVAVRKYDQRLSAGPKFVDAQNGASEQAPRVNVRPSRPIMDHRGHPVVEIQVSLKDRAINRRGWVADDYAHSLVAAKVGNEAFLRLGLPSGGPVDFAHIGIMPLPSEARDHLGRFARASSRHYRMYERAPWSVNWRNAYPRARCAHGVVPPQDELDRKTLSCR